MLSHGYCVVDGYCFGQLKAVWDASSYRKTANRASVNAVKHYSVYPRSCYGQASVALIRHIISQGVFEQSIVSWKKENWAFLDFTWLTCNLRFVGEIALQFKLTRYEDCISWWSQAVEDIGQLFTQNGFTQSSMQLS